MRKELDNKKRGAGRRARRGKTRGGENQTTRRGIKDQRRKRELDDKNRPERQEEERIRQEPWKAKRIRREQRRRKLDESLRRKNQLDLLESEVHQACLRYAETRNTNADGSCAISEAIGSISQMCWADFRFCEENRHIRQSSLQLNNVLLYINCSTTNLKSAIKTILLITISTEHKLMGTTGITGND